MSKEKVCREISKLVFGEEGLYKYISKVEGGDLFISKDRLSSVISERFKEKIEEYRRRLPIETLRERERLKRAVEKETIQRLEYSAYPYAFFLSLEEKKLANSLIECYCIAKALRGILEDNAGYPNFLKIDISLESALKPLYQNDANSYITSGVEDYYLNLYIEENFRYSKYRISPSAGFSANGLFNVKSHIQNPEIKNEDVALYYSILINYIRLKALEIEKIREERSKEEKIEESIVRDILEIYFHIYNSKRIFYEKGTYLTYKDVLLLEIISALKKKGEEEVIEILNDERIGRKIKLIKNIKGPFIQDEKEYIDVSYLYPEINLCTDKKKARVENS